LDYNFSSEKSCYFVRKYHGKNDSFRDTVLPLDKRLEEKLGEQRGNALKFHPDKFMDFKARSILCNDPPSNLYMSVFLWNKIFQNYLSPDQYHELQRRNPKKTQYITLNIDNLTKDINYKYIKNGNIRITWIKDAMKFLEKANLAEFISQREVTIYYHNLQKRSISKKNRSNKATSEYVELHELGRLIAQQYCNNFNKKKRQRKDQIDETPMRRKQSSLFDF